MYTNNQSDLSLRDLEEMLSDFKEDQPSIANPEVLRVLDVNGGENGSTSTKLNEDCPRNWISNLTSNFDTTTHGQFGIVLR